MTKPSSRLTASDRVVVLPEQTPFTGDRLEPRHDYDTTEFVDRDFAGPDVPDVRFLGAACNAAISTGCPSAGRDSWAPCWTA